MRLTHEPLHTDLLDMELIELKFMFDRGTWLLRVMMVDFNHSTTQLTTTIAISSSYPTINPVVKQLSMSRVCCLGHQLA